ncbi:L,D-transpeptidase family protein [Psychromonas sp. MME1]|uniref:L,D-transpeptidase family protein n=1 Tax=Psychromonas sp. MME1 TaxID=3231032 RepID=UPI0034E2FB5F
MAILQNMDVSFIPPSQQSIDAFFNSDSSAQKTHYLQSISSKPAQYKRLYLYLLDYYASIDINEAVAPFTETIKKGENIEQKDLLLTRLLLAREINEQQKKAFETTNKNFYTLELEETIKNFQRRHGLTADGVIGRKTQYWLNLHPQERLRLMAINTLRSELWAINNGNQVLVNIPDYTMEYWEMGEKIFQSRVIVGRYKRKTPILTAKLDSIIFNPIWRVPTKIMRKDILPNALQNLDYFKKHQYEIFADWTSQKPLSIDDIDWQTYNANNFPYKLRQKAGPMNALGQYKFNTPNNQSIYLHDTPAKSLFNKEARPFSSGCIRVEQAGEFAHLLLSKSGFSDETYRQHSEQDETTVLGLTEVIIFSTIYQTVWVDDNGITQFRSDIYQYDRAYLSQNAQIPLLDNDYI